MTTAAELNEIATKLEKALAVHDRLVAAEGKKIGDKLGLQYAKAAKEQIADKDHELQRANDLVAELRRQMKVLVRHSDQYGALKKRLQELAGTAHKIGEGIPPAVLLAAITNAERADYTNPEANQASVNKPLTKGNS